MQLRDKVLYDDKGRGWTLHPVDYCPNSSSEKSKEGGPGTTEADQISAPANQGTAETDGQHQQLVVVLVSVRGRPALMTLIL